MKRGKGHSGGHKSKTCATELKATNSSATLGGQGGQVGGNDEK